MASYNSYSGDWYVNVGNGTGTIYLDASLQVNGNITYVSELAVNDAFIIAGANNNVASNVTSVGLLTGKPTNPTSYAGIRYNATADAWQVSTDVYGNGVANTVSYSNIVISAAGFPGYIQFNNNGAFDASTFLTYDAGTQSLVVPSVVTNTILSDDSSFINIEEGLNVLGPVVSPISTNTPRNLANLVPQAGSRAFVNDGNLSAAGNFGALIGSGGSNVVPVWADGSNWYVG